MVENFKHFLEGRYFTIYTDHKPIIYAFKQRNEKASPRQMRQLQYISEFSTDIKHIKGSENIVADTLSRIESVKVIDYDIIAKAQINDNELQQLKLSNSLHFKPCKLDSGETLWCDISTTNIRPYIPIDFRRFVFNKIHNLSHSGVKSTVRQLTNKYIWTNIKKDVRIWTQQYAYY